MKINYGRVWPHLEYSRGKLPRKVKKWLIGTLMKKSKLKALLKKVYVQDHEEYGPIIRPHEFCPKCGCMETIYVDHGVRYPEIWKDQKCMRCNFIVASADNSRWVHSLECKENNYEI